MLKALKSGKWGQSPPTTRRVHSKEALAVYFSRDLVIIPVALHAPRWKLVD